MRIRTKIALMYTQMTFMVLLGAFTLVYVISSGRSQAGYYDQLWERAMLTAQINFSQDEMPDNVYRNLQSRYKFSLNEERSFIFNADSPNVADSLKRVIPRERLIQEILNGRTIEYETGSRQYIGIYYPDNRNNYIVIVSAYDKRGADDLRNLFELLVVILISSTVLVYLIGMIYARRVMDPISTIIRNVKKITANNLKRSLREERGNDELSELSRTFNDMIERLRTSFDMQNSFIRNASHELRNPLTAILGETELALSKPRTTEEYETTLKTVLFETERLNSMMQDLLKLAQTDFDFSQIKKVTVNIEMLVAEIDVELQRMFPGGHIEIVTEENRAYEIKGAASLLKLALLNLIGNAVKFSNGHPVIVRIGMQNTRVKIEIIDQGIGIPQNELRHIFQPFHRAANTAGYKGTGIGLALAKRIIDLHGGKLALVSQVEKGTTVTVRLTQE